MNKRLPPIVLVIGRSGSGKTTLLERLIPELTKRGIRIGTIKHHPHSGDLDQEGKDSYRHSKAGAKVSVVSSPSQVLVLEKVEEDQDLRRLVERFMPDVDLVLAEGYKHLDLPRIEVYRPELGESIISGPKDELLALVCDAALETHAPRLSFGQAAELADLLIKRFFEDLSK